MSGMHPHQQGQSQTLPGLPHSSAAHHAAETSRVPEEEGEQAGGGAATE